MRARKGLRMLVEQCADVDIPARFRPGLEDCVEAFSPLSGISCHGGISCFLAVIAREAMRVTTGTRGLNIWRLQAFFLETKRVLRVVERQYSLQFVPRHQGRPQQMTSGKWVSWVQTVGGAKHEGSAV